MEIAAALGLVMFICLLNGQGEGAVMAAMLLILYGMGYARGKNKKS